MVSILYLFFKISDKYFKSSTETKVVANFDFFPNLALLPNPIDDKNKVAKAKGVKYFSKLRGIIFISSL